MFIFKFSWKFFFLILLQSIFICCNKVKNTNNTTIPVAANNSRKDHTQVLRHELFRNRPYTPNAFPIVGGRQSVNISLRLRVAHVHKLEDNVMRSQIAIQFTWKDENLRWNVSKFGGIQQIHLSLDEVYHPNISIKNSLDPARDSRRAQSFDMVVLNYDGGLRWAPRLGVETVCEMQLDDWPTDVQTCAFRLMPNTIFDQRIDINPIDQYANVMTSLYRMPAWIYLGSIVEKRASFVTMISDLSGHLRQFYEPEVIYFLRFRRRSTMHGPTIRWPAAAAFGINCIALLLSPSIGGDTVHRRRVSLSAIGLLSLIAILWYQMICVGYSADTLPRISASSSVYSIAILIAFTFATIIWTTICSKFIEYYKRKNVRITPTVVRLLRPIFLIDAKEDAQPLIRLNTIAIVQIFDRFLFVIFILLFWLFY